MSVVVEDDASIVREGVLFLKSGCNNAVEDFDKPRLRTISFSSIWGKVCGASSSRITSSSFASTPEESSSLMSGSFPKIYKRRSSSQCHGLLAPSKPWEFQTSDNSSCHWFNVDTRCISCIQYVVPKIYPGQQVSYQNKHTL